MSLISRKIAAFAKKVADLADKPNLGSTAFLKQQFDSSPEELRVAHNGLVDDLASTTPGSSGSESLGSAPITGVAGTTSYAQLSNLKAQLDSAIINPNPAFVSRQAIINGNFSINQRAVSGTVTLTAGQYGHDRWKAGAAGCTYTFSTANNITTLTITAGSLVQILEGVNLFSGTYTLSWSGTSQGKIDAGSYGTGSITGNAIGGTNLSIEFNAGTLSKVQLNAGSTSLPFQPRSFSEELALCQRYYWQILQDSNNSRVGLGFASAATAANIIVKHPVRMRVNPTLVYSVVGDLELSNDSAAIAATSLSMAIGVSNRDAGFVSVGVASGLVVNAPYWLEYSGAAAGKKIGFDAEL